MTFHDVISLRASELPFPWLLPAQLLCVWFSTNARTLNGRLTQDHGT